MLPTAVRIGTSAAAGILRSCETDAHRRQVQPVQLRMPYFAGRDGKGAGDRAGGNDLAGGKRRVVPIRRQQVVEMAQRGERSVQHVARLAPVAPLTVATEDD